jgi:hypothetical protein
MQRIAHDLKNMSRLQLAVRISGALLILFVGADHYYTYSVDDYSVLPTIGVLFLLNFISATAVGLALLAPLDRIFHRFGKLVLQLVTLSGAGIAATSLVALLVSEQTKLFGFMETNYRTAIIVAIVSESAATLTLSWLLALTFKGTRPVSERSRPSVAERPRASAGTT